MESQLWTPYSTVINGAAMNILVVELPDNMNAQLPPNSRRLHAGGLCAVRQGKNANGVMIAAEAGEGQI